MWIMRIDSQERTRYIFAMFITQKLKAMAKKDNPKPIEVGGLIDTAGNKLVLMSDDSVVLKLYAEPRARHIGFIKDNVLHVEIAKSTPTEKQIAMDSIIIC